MTTDVILETSYRVLSVVALVIAGIKVAHKQASFWVLDFVMLLKPHFAKTFLTVFWLNRIWTAVYSAMKMF